MNYYALLLAIPFLSMQVWGQGSLTPTGAPAAVMKTLDQVEPRKPVSNSQNTSISKAGSYYLTENITNGISIEGDNIVLDLMGYSCSKQSGAVIRIYNWADHITVKNGILLPGSDAYGIQSESYGNCFENLTINGFNAPVGIYANSSDIIRNCSISGTYGDGILAGSQVEIRNCRLLRNNTLTGITASNNCIIVGNIILGGGDMRGLRLQGTNNLVSDNIVKGFIQNYVLAAGNQIDLLLSEVPETISWPCKVTFAGTLSCSDTTANGLTIASDHVTVDMAGHALLGPGSSSQSGIYQSDTYSGLHVMNGIVANWRGNTKSGIQAMGQSAIINDVQVNSNYYGLYVGDNVVLERCTATANSSIGFTTEKCASLTECIALTNGYMGFYLGWGNTIANCSALGNGGSGIYLDGRGCTISECTATENTDAGIYASIGDCIIKNSAVFFNWQSGIRVNGAGAVISDCSVQYNGLHGIMIDSDCLVKDNTCTANGHDGDGAGIFTEYHDNRIENNNCTDNDWGIKVDGNGNFIVKNTASGNTTNFSINAGSHYGTIQTSISGAGPWDNFEF
jgi:parallel beta-helix repeat protein